MGKVVLKYTNT